MGRAPVGRPDETLAVDIRRQPLNADQLAAEFFESVIIETEAELDTAIGNAALGDEAPDDLFQHLFKVHASAPVRRDLRGSQTRFIIMARSLYRCDTFSVRQRSRQSRPQPLSCGPPITPFSGASANFEASHYSIRLTPTTAPLEWRLPGSGTIDGWQRLRRHHRLRTRLPLCRIRHAARASDCSRFMTFETGS